jgi:hypothetical protein
MKSSRVLFSAGAFLILAVATCHAQTVAVGSCRPQLTSYSTISAAVAAVTPGSTILVCPGTYPESPTITTSLTLQGLTSEAGVRTVYVQSISVQGAGPVNISNLVVGQGETTGGGIIYRGSSGTVENVDVRSGGISALGLGVGPGSSVNVVSSSILGGTDADGTVSAGSELNLTNNWIVGDVNYGEAGGLVQGNTIFGGVSMGGSANPDTAPTINENTFVGADCAVSVGGSLQRDSTVVITNNRFISDSIGICPSQYALVQFTIEGNAFLQSSVAAIDFEDCSSGDTHTIKRNTFVGAPIGVEGVGSATILTGNNFYNVTTPTTACTGKSVRSDK